jgi:hypothetical protein
MIDIEKFIFELEIQIEKQELRRLGLNEEEVNAYFEFDSWYDESIEMPEGTD